MVGKYRIPSYAQLHVILPIFKATTNLLKKEKNEGRERGEEKQKKWKQNTDVAFHFFLKTWDNLHLLKEPATSGMWSLSSPSLDLRASLSFS